MYENVFESLPVTNDDPAVHDDTVTTVTVPGLYYVERNGESYLIKFNSMTDIECLVCPAYCDHDYLVDVDNTGLLTLDSKQRSKAAMLGIKKLGINAKWVIPYSETVYNRDDWHAAISDRDIIKEAHFYTCEACPWHDYALGRYIYESGLVPDGYSGNLSQLGWEARCDGWAIEKIGSNTFAIWCW